MTLLSLLIGLYSSSNFILQFAAPVLPTGQIPLHSFPSTSAVDLVALHENTRYIDSGTYLAIKIANNHMISLVCSTADCLKFGLWLIILFLSEDHNCG